MPYDILLLEPGYQNKYPPLGLMKISSYHRAKGDNVLFAKGIKPELLKKKWDRVYVTTLFSFEYARIGKQIDFAIQCAKGQAHRVFVGGIAASLMTDEFLSEPKWYGVRFIKGLLDKAPALSLQLDSFNGDFRADDFGNTSIEDHVPDYSILDHISDEYVYPVIDAYFGYASRGCIRKCHFCGVPKLEGMQRDSISISHLVKSISEAHGEKKDLVLMDNNITASFRFKEIMAEIRDNGFQRDAKIVRNGKSSRRRVDFNQGVDARILCKDPMYLREMASTCVSPLRIAFDHLGLRKAYSKAVEYANGAGLSQLSNYMLYNFHDTPADLFHRMKLNIDLNERLGIRIWSFPMRYQPVTLKDRSHVGDKWSWFELRSFQVMLQATHGVVSGNPVFFRRAYGECVEEFEQLLHMPHHMIFSRHYYEALDGKEERALWQSSLANLTPSQYNEFREALSLLSSSSMANLESIISAQKDTSVRDLLVFYRPIGKIEEERISDCVSKSTSTEIDEKDDTSLSAEQWVEDAGLHDDCPSGSSLVSDDNMSRV